MKYLSKFIQLLSTVELLFSTWSPESALSLLCA